MNKNTWKLIWSSKNAQNDCKWVFKATMKENGEVAKDNAWLMAKGYEQEYGIN